MNSVKEELGILRHYRVFLEILETVVLTAVMFFVINQAVQNYDVDGPSMEPSLHNQERIMVDKVSYLFHAPERGDVVVFVAPPQPQLNYVKRIVAVPGDVISVVGTRVTVDGAGLNETYVSPAYQGNPYSHSITNLRVPNDEYFVMGDDRADSYDSRAWGFLPRKNIIGRAALIYWPFGIDNYGFLPNVSAVFSQVHQQTRATSSTGMSSTLSPPDASLSVFPCTFLVFSGRRKKRRSSNVYVVGLHTIKANEM